MTKIEEYLNDGANWQAQAVLAYLRAAAWNVNDISYVPKSNDCAFRVKVGRYENCREQGYVFTLWYWNKQRHYAVYEHRNTDRITVLISNTLTTNTPTIEEMWADKGENPKSSDYDKSFAYGEILECGRFIIEDMRKTAFEWKEEILKKGEQWAVEAWGDKKETEKKTEE